MSHVIRVTMLLCLIMTQYCQKVHCSDLKPLYAGKVGNTQHFGKGNEVLLQILSEPSGGNGSYITSWEYRYANSDTWSTITNLTSVNIDGFLSTKQFSNIDFNPDGIYIRRKVASGNLTAYTNSIRVKNKTSFLSLNSQGGAAFIDLIYLSKPSLPDNFVFTELWTEGDMPGWIEFNASSGGYSKRQSVMLINVLENDGGYRSGRIEICYTGHAPGSNFRVDRSNYATNRIYVGVEQAGKSSNNGFPFTLNLKDVTIKPEVKAPFIPVVKSESDQNWFCWWQYSYDKTNWVDMLDVSNPEIGYQPDNLNYKTKHFRLAANNGDEMRTTEIVTINVNDIADESDETNPLPGNYIMTSAPLVGKTSSTPGSADEMTSIQYFDGLGRPTQIVQQGITPTRADLVTLTEYDNYGRDWRKWLPATFAENQGRCVTDADFISKSIETNRDALPFVQSDYENSPLNRVNSEWGAGENWKSNNKSVQIEYETNGDNDVYNFMVQNHTLANKGYYAAANLYLTTSKDEDNHIVKEFKDKLDRVILKRSVSETGNHDTYYVYDEYDNLCYIIPPMASDLMGSGINQDVMNKYVYQYCYDSHNRCISKKLPGADWIEMVYDKADRLILSQNGNQRKHSIWLFNKYDVHGRLIITGKIKESRSKEELRNAIKDLLIVESDTNDNSNYGYTCINYPLVQPDDILLVNYYDKNTILSQTNNDKLAFEKVQNYDARYTNSEVANPEQGLLTGKRVKLLDGSGEILTAYYYDAMGRVVQTRRINHAGGYDLEYTAYSFTGKPLRKRNVHNVKGGTDVTEEYVYSYDHANRLTQTTHSLNGLPPVVLSTLAYNELGELKTKVIHNATDTINYSYNVRGWLKTINSRQFNEALHYETAYNQSTPCYNGNISAMEWSTAYGGSQKRSYQYNYDQLNRIKDAIYSPDDIFSERIAQYDKNGNILGIVRKGYVDNLTTKEKNLTGEIDNFSLSYNGNQLTKVVNNKSDSENIVPVGTNNFRDRQGAPNDKEYLYDANGNTTGDFNKNIAWIRYNYLNLPEKIQFCNGNICEYLYDASGVKHRATYRTSKQDCQISFGDEMQTTPDSLLKDPKIIDYYGNFLHEHGGQLLTKILTPEGHIICGNSPGGLYGYNYKDHLGNNRVFGFALSDEFLISLVSHYYPFGMEYSSRNRWEVYSKIRNPVNSYRFNGKELDNMHGLNWYDYGARWYDPAIARWNAVDPLGEEDHVVSPYAYCENNPVKFIDPDGKQIIMPPFFGMNPVLAGSSSPLLGAADLVKIGAKTATEAGAKASKGPGGNRPPINMERINAGRRVEAEQLKELGLEKNTKSITRTDPKTGKDVTTIPDAITKEGGTLDVKHLKPGITLHRTKQLRAQEVASKEVGELPRIHLNEGVNISKPLQNAGFKITRYGIIPERLEMREYDAILKRLIESNIPSNY